ncbi:MAG: tagaturonate reductase [Bacteroidetes bacterium]|nr:tagaturonate reductase [Bacteroidota bacterium]
MNLSKENLAAVKTAGVIKPDAGIFTLPEKVLQFGTGVLLRGLPDYFIDKANRQGLFNGRVVVVKSTESGDAGAFDRQDGLYTLCVRGIEEGKKVEENIICSAISRVLSAKNQWDDILSLASRPEMQIIVSNTTEVGIQLVEEEVLGRVPASFPGKLLAFLYGRYTAFDGSAESGMVIIPTELIVDNGKKLLGIVKQLAAFNKLDDEFVEWVDQHCRFCSSLVDRIVPGKPDAATLAKLTQELGYTDDLLAISEVYRLWAIEGDEKVKSVLSFASADAGVIIAPDIEIYRELKLRLLNGTHTLSCGLAVLAGFPTVKSAMDDAAFSAFVADLMLKEIAPNIPYELPLAEARDFGLKVLDRFRNPHIQHQWISITMQYSSKIKMRVVPVLLHKYHEEPLAHVVLGFAAYLLFMKGASGPVTDDKAAYFSELWKQEPDVVVTTALKDQGLWGADLTEIPGFEGAVRKSLDTLINKGATTALAQLANK